MQLYSLSPSPSLPLFLSYMCVYICVTYVLRFPLIIFYKFSQFSSATSDDLWTAIQIALDQSDVPHEDFKYLFYFI